jgi:hypothetical protein
MKPVPISLETELSATAFDQKTGNCSYTIFRNNRHWTVEMHINNFGQINRATLPARRVMLQTKLAEAMLGPSDEEKVKAAATQK